MEIDYPLRNFYLRVFHSSVAASPNDRIRRRASYHFQGEEASGGSEEFFVLFSLCGFRVSLLGNYKTSKRHPYGIIVMLSSSPTLRNS